MRRRPMITARNLDSLAVGRPSELLRGQQQSTANSAALMVRAHSQGGDSSQCARRVKERQEMDTHHAADATVAATRDEYRIGERIRIRIRQ